MSDTKDEAAEMLAQAQAKQAKLEQLLNQRSEATAAYASNVADIDKEIMALVGDGATLPGKRGRGRPKGSGKKGKVGRPKKAKRGRPAKTDGVKRGRGRPRLSDEEKAARAAAKGKTVKKAKTGTGRRGRPPLSAEEKAARAAAKAKTVKKAKTVTGKHRGRPRLSDEEKARRKAERETVEEQTDAAQESVDSMNGQNGDVPPDIDVPDTEASAETSTESTDTE